MKDPAPGQLPGGREPSIDELSRLAQHAQQRVALYRRRVLTGRGDPRALAELERVSAGAAGRLRRARDRRTPETTGDQPNQKVTP